MNDEKKINAVVEIYNKYNIQSEAEIEINNYYQHALLLIKKVSVAEERKSELYKLTEMVFKRNY